MNIADKIKNAKAEIANCVTAQDYEKIRINLLGRKGLFNKLFSEISQLPPEEKREKGKQLNQYKQEIQKLLSGPKKSSAGISRNKTKSYYQLAKLGHEHPITITQNKLNELFRKLNFSLYEGPEIETDEFCFERLNVPKNHPSRELQDSIYIKKPEILLRTQTSSIEARLLNDQKPPFKASFPGRVYRNEKVNKSNHFVFHQYQAVAVDKAITLKDLIGTLNYLFKNMFGPDVKVRFRCKYYPEVEPGLGMDIQCFSCQGKGCVLCKQAGWIEMGGAGIIHPKVMKMAKIDPKKWKGFAFGLGLDRWVMAKYNIQDIRTLLGGNLAYQPNI
jgi:phenylalanyl-tRNA synthetase alpha chain